MELTTRQRLLVALVVLVIFLVGLEYVVRPLYSGVVLAPGSRQEPGDIVMLYYPRDPEKPSVKRVIAREGDTVRIEDGRVYVNEVLLSDEYVPPVRR